MCGRTFSRSSAIQEARAVDEGVAVQPAQPGELGPLQAGDHPQHAGLLAMLQLGLEADDIVERAQRVVLPELNHRMRPAAGARVGEAHGLHRPEAERVAAAGRHDLDRQAALEIGRARLPFLELGLLGREQRVDEGRVLPGVHRAVDVVGTRAAGPGLVVARLEPCRRHVDALAVDDGGDGIEEGQLLLAARAPDILGQGRRGEGACRHDGLAPLGRGQARHLLAPDRHQRLRLERCLDARRKARPGPPPGHRRPAACGGRPWPSRASPAGASPRAAGPRRCPSGRRSGTSSSRRARPAGPSCARRSPAPAASRAATTGTPARASCQAASEPARPPPITWTACIATLPKRLR